jgi:hypothetical protein
MTVWRSRATSAPPYHVAVASLASAARVLKPYYPEVAERALRNAVMLWKNIQKTPILPK